MATNRVLWPDVRSHTEMGLVTCQEIAAILGVTRQRVQQLSHTEGFPAPRYVVGRTYLWQRSKIDRWLARK